MIARRYSACLGWIGSVVFAAVAFAQAPPGVGPPIPAPDPANFTFPALQQVSPRLDFGAHAPLTFISETMTFVNSGKVPITLERAQGECSCTDATILGDLKPIQPGEKVDVLVAVEFPRESALYTKKLLIYEKGNPVPFQAPFDFEVGYAITINGGPRYAIVTELGGRITLESRTKTPFKVLSISGMAPMYDSFDPAKDALRDTYAVFYTLEGLKGAELPRWLVIETDHPDAEMMTVAARIKGGNWFIDKTQWHAMDEFIALGRISASGPTRTTMLFTGKAVLPGKILTIKSSNTSLGVQVVAVRQPDRGGGMQVDMDIIPRPDLKGFASTIATIDYDGASARFDLFCRIDPNIPAPPVPNK